MAATKLIMVPDLDSLPQTALLTEPEMAAAVAFSARTLKRWRLEQDPRGPPFILIAGHVRYRVSDARHFLCLPPKSETAFA